MLANIRVMSWLTLWSVFFLGQNAFGYCGQMTVETMQFLFSKGKKGPPPIFAGLARQPHSKLTWRQHAWDCADHSHYFKGIHIAEGYLPWGQAKIIYIKPHSGDAIAKFEVEITADINANRQLGETRREILTTLFEGIKIECIGADPKVTIHRGEGEFEPFCPKVRLVIYDPRHHWDVNYFDRNSHRLLKYLAMNPAAGSRSEGRGSGKGKPKSSAEAAMANPMWDSNLDSHLFQRGPDVSVVGNQLSEEDWTFVQSMVLRTERMEGALYYVEPLNPYIDKMSSLQVIKFFSMVLAHQGTNRSSGWWNETTQAIRARVDRLPGGFDPSYRNSLEGVLSERDW